MQEYKSIILQFSNLFMNVKQRLDLAHRSLDTIDYRIQLEIYYQNGLKSISEKYQDNKIDEVYNFISSEASQKAQVQDQLKIDFANARAQFSDDISIIYNQLNQVAAKKLKICKDLKFQHEKYYQQENFASSIQKVYERNIVSLELLDRTVDERMGMIKTISDLKTKHIEYIKSGEQQIRVYNDELVSAATQLQELLTKLKELDEGIAESIKTVYQRIILAQFSSMKNTQYDLDSMVKFLEKVNFTKVKYNFKINDELFQPLKFEQQYTFLTRELQHKEIKYKFIEQEQLKPIELINITPDIEEKIIRISQNITQISSQQLEKELDSLVPEINAQNSTSLINQFSISIKAPTPIPQANYNVIGQFFNKILPLCPKEGVTIFKLQKFCNSLYYVNNKTPKIENITLFQSVAQNDIFQKKYEYWEWLLYHQLSQVIEGIDGIDRQLVILQYFQTLLQQMAQLQIPNLQSFIQDLSPYYRIEPPDQEQIKRLLQQFQHAQLCDPKSKARYQSFDSVE
ncbi:hypothetical protein pb186bvf_002957 [Paramecium bursaria]